MKRNEISLPVLPPSICAYHDVVQLRAEMAQQSLQALGLMAGVLLSHHPEARDASWIVMTASHPGRALSKLLEEFGVSSVVCLQSGGKKGPNYNSGSVTRSTKDRLARSVKRDSGENDMEANLSSLELPLDDLSYSPVADPTKFTRAARSLDDVVAVLKPLGHIDLSPDTDALLSSVDTTAPIAMQIEQMARELGRKPPWTVVDARKITRRLLRLYLAKRLPTQDFPALDDGAITTWLAVHGHYIASVYSSPEAATRNQP